jgi:hypothetical protein
MSRIPRVMRIIKSRYFALLLFVSRTVSQFGVFPANSREGRDWGLLDVILGKCLSMALCSHFVFPNFSYVLGGDFAESRKTWM